MPRNTFPLNLQVKQYVSLVHTCQTGATFRVFLTGDDKFYLFDTQNEQGVSWGHQFPVRKTELQPDVRRALRAGMGNTEDSRSGCRNRPSCQKTVAETVTKVEAKSLDIHGSTV